MPKNRQSVEAVSEIRVAPQPSGLRAVYLVETNDSRESREVEKLFADLEEQVQVRQLSKGKLVSFAVQATSSDTALLDELDDVLKSNYGFVVSHRSFDDVIHRIVRELCNDTGSKLLAVPTCNICGKIDPFPNILVTLSDDDGSVLMSRSYCASCTSGVSAKSNKEFVRSLLSADKRNFDDIAQAELIRRPTKSQPIRFKVKADDTKLAANT